MTRFLLDEIELEAQEYREQEGLNLSEDNFDKEAIDPFEIY